MKVVKLLLKLCLFGFLLIVALLLAFYFSPALQGWAVRQAVKDLPDTQIEVGYVKLRLSELVLREVRVRQPGTAVRFETLEVHFSPWAVLFDETVEVSRLHLLGLEADLSQAAAAPAPTAAPARPIGPDDVAQPAAPAAPSGGAAAPVAAPAKPFPGVLALSREKLPYHLRIDDVRIEGEVLLPESQALSLTLQGGGLAPGRTGVLDGTVMLDSPASPVGPVELAHKVEIAQPATRGLQELRVQTTLRATRPEAGVPPMTVRFSLTPSGSGERYTLSLASAGVEARSLANLDFLLEPTFGKVTGQYRVEMTPADFALFAALAPVPALTLNLKGEVSGTLDGRNVAAQGDLTLQPAPSPRYPSAPSLHLEHRAQWTGEALSLLVPLKIEGPSGTSDLKLDITCNPLAQPKTFDVRLRSDFISVDDLARLGQALSPEPSAAPAASPAKTSPAVPASTPALVAADSPAAAVQQVAAVVADAVPAWAGLQGSLSLDLARIDFGPQSLRRLEGKLAILPENLSFDLQAQLQDRPLRIRQDLAFRTAQPLPYRLTAEVLVDGLDLGAIQRALQPEQPPAAEGTFTLKTSLAAEGATLAELGKAAGGLYALQPKAPGRLESASLDARWDARGSAFRRPEILQIKASARGEATGLNAEWAVTRGAQAKALVQGRLAGVPETQSVRGDFKVDIQADDYAALAAGADLPRVLLTGAADLQAKADGSSSSLAGEFTLTPQAGDEPKPQVLKIGTRVQADAQGRVQAELPVLLKGASGDSDLKLVAQIETAGVPLRFDVKLTGRQVLADDFQKLAAALQPAARKPEPTVEAPAGPDPQTPVDAQDTPAPAAPASAPVPPGAPAWAAVNGVAEVAIDRIVASGQQVDDFKLHIEVTPDAVRLTNTAVQLGGQPLEAAAALTFATGAPRPYGLQGKFQIPGFDAGAYLRRMDPQQPKPLVDGIFTVKANVQAQTVDLPYLVDDLQGDFLFESHQGKFRPLQSAIGSKTSAGLAAVGLAGQLLGGKNKTANTLSEAANIINQTLTEIAYDKMEVRALRGADRAFVLENIEVRAYQLGISGDGRLEQTPGVPMDRQALAAQLRLAVDGRSKLARALNDLRLLPGKQDEAGYYVGPEFDITGSPGALKTNLGALLKDGLTRSFTAEPIQLPE